MTDVITRLVMAGAVMMSLAAIAIAPWPSWLMV